MSPMLPHDCCLCFHEWYLNASCALEVDTHSLSAALNDGGAVPERLLPVMRCLHVQLEQT